MESMTNEEIEDIQEMLKARMRKVNHNIGDWDDEGLLSLSTAALAIVELEKAKRLGWGRDDEKSE
jgi:hypothetical protein